MKLEINEVKNTSLYSNRYQYQKEPNSGYNKINKPDSKAVSHSTSQRWYHAEQYAPTNNREIQKRKKRKKEKKVKKREKKKLAKSPGLPKPPLPPPTNPQHRSTAIVLPFRAIWVPQQQCKYPEKRRGPGKQQQRERQERRQQQHDYQPAYREALAGVHHGVLLLLVR